MLDINLFREEKGNNPEKIRESQRRRYASIEIVDEIIQFDNEWRQRKFPSLYSARSVSHLMSFLTVVWCRFCIGQFELDSLRREFNKQNKKVAQLKIVSNFNYFFLFIY